MSDEGFHEIQLNGKQLVFLFMAATVVSVVIFLCGVMVGRGVRAERGAADATEPTMAAAPAVEPVAAPAPPAKAVASDARRQEPEAASPPPNAVPPAPAEDDDAYQAMMRGDQPAEPPAAGAPPKAETIPTPSDSASTIASAASKPEPKKNDKAEKVAAPEKAAKSDKTTPPVRPDMEPTDPNTFAVQVAALRERSEADAIAKRLSGRGYQAYVLVPAIGAPPVYKVQVGRFKNRQDAEKTAARLKKEEQFSPWVTR